MQRAKKRLEDLNYFDSVDISTVPGSSPTRSCWSSTWSRSRPANSPIGAGYSTGGDTPGPSIEGSITERNFLGRGQFIKLSAGGGKNSRDYSLSFTEPYFLGRRIAAGFDIYRRRGSTTHYDSETTGATVRFGLPITDSIYRPSLRTISLRKNTSSDDGCDPTVIDIPIRTCNISAGHHGRRRRTARGSSRRSALGWSTTPSTT